MLWKTFGMRVMSVVGTRPEAIKMAPVVRAIRRSEGLESILCLTGQHVESVTMTMDLFGLSPQLNLQLTHGNQTLSQTFASVLSGMEQAIKESRPDIVLVQGDTTSAVAASTAAFYTQTRIGHIEAGLRTHDLTAPWPEEGNRQIVSRMAQLHFAPSVSARRNLIREGVSPDRIHVTGNTVIDALLFVRDEVLALQDASIQQTFPWYVSSKRLILVTGHRRENHANVLAGQCRALVRLAARGDCQIAFVKHMNPVVQAIVDSVLSHVSGIFILEPQAYPHFVWLMAKAYAIITDSGGIQEEAPTLGTPVLVVRRTTERLEATSAGTVRLIGTSEARIYSEVVSLLDDPHKAERMRRVQNLYGNGQSSNKIVDVLRREGARGSFGGFGRATRRRSKKAR